jgi:L-threonylcarbamoyladenylate synthase
MNEDTKIWRLDSSDLPEADAIREAATLLQAGKAVAFPTETVYGLGANARSDEAVGRIFEAKGRPSDNPLIVHIAHREQLYAIVTEVPPMAGQLMDRFWPGALTIVLPVKPGAVSAKVTAGLHTVAVRMPDHPVALALISAANCPIAAPSANRSGRPSPTKAEHVLEDLRGRIAGVVDGGASDVGLESTVVEIIGESVVILRPGGVSAEQLREVASQVTLDPAIQRQTDMPPSAPRSPGMKYAHYAPEGRMVVVIGDHPGRIRARIHSELAAAQEQGLRTGVLTSEESKSLYAADLIVSYGAASVPAEAAHRLYDALRSFDLAGIQFIAAEGLSEQGMGLAVMNRLVKAAGGHKIQV